MIYDSIIILPHESDGDGNLFLQLKNDYIFVSLKQSNERNVPAVDGEKNSPDAIVHLLNNFKPLCA